MKAFYSERLEIYNASNVNPLPIKPGSVDLVVTSPPYKSKQGFSYDDLQQLHHNIGTWLREGGLYFLNFGQLEEDFGRATRLHSLLCSMEPKTLFPMQTIIWVKSLVVGGVGRGHFKPIISDSLLNYGWEYLFVFAKATTKTNKSGVRRLIQKRPKLDRLSIGCPYTDKSNLTRGTRGKNGDVRCAGDVWFIPYETTGKTKKKKHEYEFPKELVSRCVKLANLAPNSTVMDPFGGSGRVAEVAHRLGHTALLVERDNEAFKLLCERFGEEEHFEVTR